MKGVVVDWLLRESIALMVFVAWSITSIGFSRALARDYVDSAANRPSSISKETQQIESVIIDKRASS